MEKTDSRPNTSLTSKVSAGHGNGTLKPLSLDGDLFSRITAKFQLPAKIRQVICSIHGVFVRFIEDQNGSEKSLRMILVFDEEDLANERPSHPSVHIQISCSGNLPRHANTARRLQMLSKLSSLRLRAGESPHGHRSLDVSR